MVLPVDHAVHVDEVSGFHAARSAPQRFALAQRQQAPAAGGTNVLIMNLAAGRAEAVVEAELIEHLFQVVEVHLRREAVAAAVAMRLRPGRSRRFIERHAESAGPLEQVKQFPEREIKQGAKKLAACAPAT